MEAGSVVEDLSAGRRSMAEGTSLIEYIITRREAAPSSASQP